MITRAMKAELGLHGYTPDQIPNLTPAEAHAILSSVSVPDAAMLPPLEGPFATWGEAEEERAAIVEHDGRIPRAWAEGFARLDPDRPTGDVPLKRWQRFVDDLGLFLDSPFCAVAAALGWGPFDLFGCDRDRPFARIDLAGMLWLLNGGRLIALSEHTATIETPTGARQTYRRKPEAPGRALPWELAP
jgi:hypothetical protein